VLKLGWIHDEALHEADGLWTWNGDGVIRLHRQHTTNGTNAMLLERCTPGTALKARPEEEQDVVIAGLLRRLWQAPTGGFRPLHQMWSDERFRELAQSSTDAVLLATDLHAGNILAAEREPWLVIDPKPYVGDRHYDVLQHLLNCRSRLLHDPDALVRRMAGLLDLDPDRLGEWLRIRCALEASHDPELAEVARRISAQQLSPSESPPELLS
jgi:streptomycin 6-kinase